MRQLALILILIIFARQSQAELLSSLITERAEVEFGAEMPVNGQFDVRFPKGMIETAEYISDFWMDRESGRFIAIVVTEDGSNLRINGNAMLMVPVPVVTRQLLPDEIIRASDLTIIELPFARVNTFAVTRAEDLVGMQVRRTLTRGRPIQRQSVMPPIVVSRGARVTIQVRSGALFISVRGKALSDAYLGQEVRVVNLESNKTVSGIARTGGIVEIIK